MSSLVKTLVATSDSRGFFNWFTKLEEQATKEFAVRTYEIARQLVSTPYPPVSSPGNPPALRTGEGRDSIKIAKFSDGSYDVFVDQPQHMAYLEAGTPTVLPRPWLSVAFEQANKELS